MERRGCVAMLVGYDSPLVLFQRVLSENTLVCSWQGCIYGGGIGPPLPIFRPPPPLEL